MALTSDRNPDMSRVMTELTRAITALNGNIADMGHSGHKTARPGSGGGGRAKPNTGAEGTEKDLKELQKTIKQTDKELKALRKGAGDTNKSFADLYDSQSQAIKGIVNNQKLSDRAHTSLVNQLHKTATSGSALGQGMQKASEKLAFLEKKLEESGNFLAEYSDALKEAGASTLLGINDNDKLRKALKKLNSEIDLSAEVKEHIARQEYKQAAELLDKEAKQSNQLRQDIGKTSRSFNNLDRQTKMLGTGLSKATDAIGLGFVKEAAKWGGAVALITNGAKELYSQFWQTASAGFGGAFMDLSINAIKLGVSLHDLTALAKENMQQVGKMGLKGFTDSLAETRLQLMQLGMTSTEAAKMRAVMNENARLTGVDIKDKGALSNAAQDQIKQYETLRAITGESMEAVAQQTKAILNDNDTMKLMSGLNKQQRVQMLQSINAERVRLTTMGLTNDAAMGVIKTFQSIQNAKTIDRVDMGNKLMAAAASMGLDPSEAMKANQIAQKGAAATPEEAKFMADFQKKLGGAIDTKKKTGDLSDGIIADYAQEMSAGFAGMQDGMRQANLGREMTPGEIEQNKILGHVSKGIADSSAKIDSWMKLIQSPLLAIAAGVGGIALMLARKILPSRKKDIARDKGEDQSPSVDRSENKKGKKKVQGRAGSDALAHPDGTPMKGAGHLGSRTSDQIEHIAKSKGWVAPEDNVKGYGALDRSTKQKQADKANRARHATRAGRDADNSTSIGSQTLQERLAQHHAERARNSGPPRPYQAPRPSLLKRLGSSRIGTAVSGGGKAIGAIAGKAAGTASGLAGKGVSIVGKAAGGLARFGAKAIPFLGWAIAGIEAMQGAFDGVSKAAEIFGVDTSKQSVTTAQKVSAGIAGALNMLSFGLIPTEDTAKFLHTAATEGFDIVKGWVSDTTEFVANNAIPALYSGFKSILGFIGGAISDFFTLDTWTGIFTGNGGEGGIVSSILNSLKKAVSFAGVAVAKGLVKIGTDIVDGILNGVSDKIPGVKALKAEWAEMKKTNDDFTSKDTKWSDFDSPKEAQERKEKEAKVAEEKKKDTNKVQGTPTEVPKDNLGLVNEFGQKLTADQLAAQGIQASPSTTTSPTVGGSAANTTKDANGNTVVNNTTNNTTTAPKTEAEKLLSGILDKVTSLVDLTDKGLKIAEADFKSTTQSRLAGGPSSNGYSPSLADFMNMPI